MAVGDKHQLTIETKEEETDSLWPRTLIAQGDAEDGAHVEVSLAGFAQTLQHKFPGAILVLQHKFPGGRRTVHSVSISELVQTWARTIDADIESMQ